MCPTPTGGRNERSGESEKRGRARERGRGWRLGGAETKGMVLVPCHESPLSQYEGGFANHEEDSHHLARAKGARWCTQRRYALRVGSDKLYGAVTTPVIRHERTPRYDLIRYTERYIRTAHNIGTAVDTKTPFRRPQNTRASLVF